LAPFRPIQDERKTTKMNEGAFRRSGAFQPAGRILRPRSDERKMEDVPEYNRTGGFPRTIGKELDMKKLIFGLLAAATVGAAVPAAAQVVIREHRDGAVTVRPAAVYPAYRHHHHRVVWFDRFHHRHVEWR
jgi:hypothetical protein